MPNASPARLYFDSREAGLENLKSHTGRVWERIPNKVRQAMLDMALARPELSPRELAVNFTDSVENFTRLVIQDVAYFLNEIWREGEFYKSWDG